MNASPTPGRYRGLSAQPQERVHATCSLVPGACTTYSASPSTRATSTAVAGARTVARRLLASRRHETKRRSRHRHDDARTTPRRPGRRHRHRADDRADPRIFSHPAASGHTRRRACRRGTRAVASPAHATALPRRCQNVNHAPRSQGVVTQQRGASHSTAIAGLRNILTMRMAQAAAA